MDRIRKNELATTDLREFFQNHHDKLLCTANKNGEPSISLMGTPRIIENGNIEFELSDDPSITLNNLLENKSVVFMVYEAASRARDYKGVRIYAEVTEILREGEKLAQIRTKIREKYGNEKADELVATVTCEIKKLRPIVDRGQEWNELPVLA
ncbi:MULTISPECIES: pyridoxamine 5'-phosphate oxidase family protein [Sphingobacterium]|uniref:Pyridoxamine 5'-phosphate oxidase n=1 Tax=Sphingobacterium multivorum TaxID=28454 RepID=A0A2X2J2D5_SPHMU|nr:MULTISPECIES: pyridoxamine 5'-phosphate oxidase family protein [Sphingobacterium]QRQ63679.1 pyridoxamine 5'-phosphate oxidase family protein [Sphingobacterium multivorum]SPZ85743.1 Pyridoxamine 5'-phosphate oxidase [Sphingobacterium multivorum]